MGLDILTERGRETVGQEMRAATIVGSVWPDCEFFYTPKERPAKIDSILVKWPIIKAVIETKCRNMSLAVLRGSFSNEWLVTHQKLLDGRSVAEGLAVEFWGLLYLVPDDIVLRVKLWIPGKKDWLPKIRIEKTTTQATVNGGVANRENAFVDMAAADVLRERSGESP